MPVFEYRAITEQGVITQGEAAAASAEDARAELSGRGLIVQSLRERRAGLSLFRRRQRVHPEEFLTFNQELIALVRAGLTLPEALRIVSDRPASPALSRVLERVEQDVRKGSALSDACGQHPDVFDGLFIAALRTGEKTGNLAEVLRRYQANLRHRIAMQRKVSHAMAYPLFLLITLGVIMLVLFLFVLPRFVALYADFGAQLPLATRILIRIVEHIPYYLLAGAAIGVLGWVAWTRWVSQDKIRRYLDMAREKVPLVGAILRVTGYALLARTLSTLLVGGTPLVEAMRITARSLTNRVRAEKVRSAARAVVEGKSLAEAIGTNGLLPDTAVKMIEVGEATGSLEQMLGEVADFFEERLEHTLTKVMTLIEPILMLLMGLLVGGTIIVMYLPIFYIADVVK